ncbi:MAG: DUF805 domain-containing protein, partial [Actinomycetota bacterium]
RDDTGAIAGRIFDRLVGHYGSDQVFMDIDSIPFGLDFREHIQDTLERCDVLLAIVGRHWAAPDHKGGFRINEENDWVRIEVEAALAKKIPVIPVLIDNAELPTPTSLPEGLRGLAFRQAAPVDSGRDFHPHMDRLIKAMDRLLRAQPSTDATRESETNPKQAAKPEPKPEITPKINARPAPQPEVRTVEQAAQQVIGAKPEQAQTISADPSMSKPSTAARLAPRLWWLAVSPNGRLPRGTFAIALLASFVLMHALTLAVGLPYNEITGHDGFPTFVLILPAFWMWVVIALATKRSHDLGWPGWPAAIALLIIVVLVRYVGLIAELATLVFTSSSLACAILLLSPLGWMRGPQGPNRYGPDPLAAAPGDGAQAPAGAA